MYARPNQGSGKRIGLVTTALLALLLAFTTTAADVAPPPRTLANLDRSRQRVLIVAPTLMTKHSGRQAWPRGSYRLEVKYG